MELLSLEPQSGTEPLLITYISFKRHFEPSCCIWLSWYVSYCTSRDLRAPTSVGLGALCDVSKRHFDMESSVLELNWKL